MMNLFLLFGCSPQDPVALPTLAVLSTLAPTTIVPSRTPTITPSITPDAPECLESILIPPVSFIVRSENYDMMQGCIESTNGIANRTRFFAAAEDVSGYIFGLGGLDLPTLDCLISDESEDFLERLGQYLYPLNFNNATRIIRSPDKLISPLNSTVVLTSSLKHDIEMVEFEQSLVEGYIQTQLASNEITQEYLNEINELFDSRITPCIIPNSANEPEVVKWARYALNHEVTFTSQSDREAIGKALIFKLHDCILNDYVDYMRNPLPFEFNEPTPPCTNLSNAPTSHPVIAYFTSTIELPSNLPDDAWLGTDVNINSGDTLTFSSTGYVNIFPNCETAKSDPNMDCSTMRFGPEGSSGIGVAPTIHCLVS
jgi:hypothetical protein